MPEKISAMILNYKHLDDTEKCIETLKSSEKGSSVDIYVVDNSPLPDTQKTLQDMFPKLNYIASTTNLGFAGGNNLAIKAAIDSGSDYCLIINPDVTVGKNFYEPLLKHFKDKKVGIVAPVIAHTQKGKKVFGLEGKVDWKYAKPEHRNLSSVEETSPIDAEFVTFACVMIRKEVFQKVGLIDSGYFMYFEDVDYCLSAREAGFKIILDPKVIVSHRTSSSFAKPTQKLGISFLSHMRFIRKWVPVYRRLIPLVYTLLTYPYLYLLWTYHGIKYKNG